MPSSRPQCTRKYCCYDILVPKLRKVGLMMLMDIPVVLWTYKLPVPQRDLYLSGPSASHSGPVFGSHMSYKKIYQNGLQSSGVLVPNKIIQCCGWVSQKTKEPRDYAGQGCRKNDTFLTCFALPCQSLPFLFFLCQGETYLPIDKIVYLYWVFGTKSP